MEENMLRRRLLLGLSFLAALATGCTKPESTQMADGAKTTLAGPTIMRTKSGVEMVLLPAGEFTMGDDNGEEDDEKPAHRVELSAFYMDVCEVTQESFRAFMGRNTSKSVADQQPVEQVQWPDAIQYCNMRSAKEGLKPCYDLKTSQCDFAADGYRLPTEAEWEYACRAGTTARWSCGDDVNGLARHAWYKQNSAKRPHPVKQKPANPWGLFDMDGNVSEWCNDFYGEKHYAASPAKDPRGPESGNERVVRGGNWAASELYCRAATRLKEQPRLADACFSRDVYGFRCVRRTPGGGGRED
jgi:formylglycine-generating enzyme required for sulfatase activity